MKSDPLAKMAKAMLALRDKRAIEVITNALNMKLKPCPFCGGEAMDWSGIIPWSPVTIECVKCRAIMSESYGYKEDRDRAIKKIAKRWNKRFD